ncbi:MAG: hypothetical protein AVDCRST_MAG78-3123, partial [uncultured Rubrobacteraceae bacterium]
AAPDRESSGQGAPGAQSRRRRRPRRRVRRDEREGQHRNARRLRGMPPQPTRLCLRHREFDPARSPRGTGHSGRL